MDISRIHKSSVYTKTDKKGRDGNFFKIVTSTPDIVVNGNIQSWKHGNYEVNKDFVKNTVVHLKIMAKELKVVGYSKMLKAELVSIVKKRIKFV